VDALNSKVKDVDEGEVEKEKKEKEEKEKKEVEDEDPDEKEEKERVEAKDCNTVWSDFSYRADLLCPGIKLTKPTKDHKSYMNKIKAKALKASFTTDSEVVSLIVKEKDLGTLQGQALDIAFVAVSEAIKVNNNRFVKDSIVTKSKEISSSIADLNKRHKEFWNKNK